MGGYHNDFSSAELPDLTVKPKPIAPWSEQPVTVPLDIYVGLRENAVRLTAERDAYSQKWSQTILERDKAIQERDEYKAIIDGFEKGGK